MGEGGERAVEVRDSSGVVVGDGNTQINYTYNGLAVTGGVAPPPLVSILGVVESPYRGLNPFEDGEEAFFFGRRRRDGDPDPDDRQADRAWAGDGFRRIRRWQVLAAARGCRAPVARGVADIWVFGHARRGARRRALAVPGDHANAITPG